jgi:ribosomal-protein-alanine N-acetyltransferase
MLKIAGNKVYLQEFTEEHLRSPEYFEWLRDLDVVRTIYRLEYLMPLQFIEIETYVKDLWASKDDCFFALYAAEERKFIGTVRLGHIDWRAGMADIGILIGDRASWGKGYATDAVRLACHYGFQELSLRKITGGTPAINTAMRRCFQRLGFVEEGCLRNQLLISGEYCDHILYGLFKEELRLGGSE